MRLFRYPLVFTGLLLMTQPLMAQHHLGTTTKRDTTVHTETTVVNEPPHVPAPPAKRRTSSVLTDSVIVAIKLNPVLLITGELPLFVEKRLNRFYSVEGAVGVTYMDLFYETSVNGGYFLGNKSAKFHSGFTARAQFRVFPRHADVAVSGLYFGPELAYRTYLMDWYEFTGLVNDVYHGKRKVSEARAVMGWQNADNSDEVVWDGYISLGARMTDEVRATEIPNVDAPPAHRITPVFGFGLKIGWGM